MTIYIPLGIIGIIITAVLFASRNASTQRGLQAILDEQAKQPGFLVNTFNRSESRRTTILEKGDMLVIDTDLQVIQLNEVGRLHLKFSSDYEGKDVKGEMTTAIDPSILLLTSEREIVKSPILALPYKDTKTKVLLDILRNDYGINYDIDMDLPATSVNLNEVKSGRKTEVTLLGDFPDGGKWNVYVNYETFKLRITATLISLQNGSNFTKYYYS